MKNFFENKTECLNSNKEQRFSHCYSFASNNLYNEWPQIHLSHTVFCSSSSSSSSVNWFKLAWPDQTRPDDWIYWINTMCTMYEVHNHHHYTHTWIHLDQSWDSKNWSKKVYCLPDSQLGIKVQLSSISVLHSKSLFIKRLEIWRKNEKKKLSSERNRAKEWNIRSDVRV